MKTGIIIPCYNEEKRLDVKSFANFIAIENQYHLCFVNDGSKDDTIKVLKTLQEMNPLKISIVDLKKNGGKAEAVRSGAKYLYNRGDINYIGFIDADLSTDFKDFKDLLKTLRANTNLSFVFGSRAKEASEEIQKDGVRAFISKCINMLIVLILGMDIKDTQCGAKVFEASIVPVMFNKRFFSRWLFDVEMFIKMKRHFGKLEIMNKIYEQPLKRWVHMEDSKLGWRDSLEIPFRLVSIWFNYNILQSLNTNNNQEVIEPVMEIYGVPSLN